MHLASWAQADVPLARDLQAGNDDFRPGAAQLLRRALAALPAQVCGRPRVRVDAGYLDGALARTVEAGFDFAIAAKRNPAVGRAAATIEESAWAHAHNMTGGPVAACDYAPAGRTGDAYTIVRRVKISRADQGRPTLAAAPHDR